MGLGLRALDREGKSIKRQTHALLVLVFLQYIHMISAGLSRFGLQTSQKSCTTTEDIQLERNGHTPGS